MNGFANGEGARAEIPTRAGPRSLAAREPTPSGRDAATHAPGCCQVRPGAKKSPGRDERRGPSVTKGD